MIKNIPIFKIVKRAVLTLVFMYLLGIAGFFLYLLPEIGLFQASLVTYVQLMRGPILRPIESVTSDEQMIASFYLKRPLLEKLLAIHDEKCFTEQNLKTFAYQEHPEVSELRREVGLVGVADGNDLWFPDPYSEHAAKSVRQRMREDDREHKKVWEGYKPGEKIPDLKELREWQKQARRQVCRYQTATFVGEVFPAHWMSRGWVHFPAAPIVENGELYVPNWVDWRKPNHERKVLPNLDSLPRQFWPIRYCVYRRVESQWFLFSCPSQ